MTERFPAPWKIVQDCYNAISILDQLNGEVCCIMDYKDGPAKALLPTGRLIKSAPRLLEACEAALTVLEGAGEIAIAGWGQKNFYHKELKVLRAAIAEAKGGENG